MIAEIIINYLDVNIDKTFDYFIPDNLKNNDIKGKRVIVPFGNQNRLVNGIVIDVKEKSQIEISKLKEIFCVIDQFALLSEEIIHLSKVMKEYYALSWGEIFNLLLPSYLDENELYKISIINFDNIEKLSEKEIECIEFIKKGSIKIGGKNFNKYQNTIFSLLSKNYISYVLKDDLIINSISRNKQDPDKSDLILTQDQEEVLKNIYNTINKNAYNNILLHGVTGSGKTEVYIQTINYILQKGKNALFLVPEIALTPQVIRYVSQRLGSSFAVLHSKLTKKERLKEWIKIKKGMARVVIGPRSAVFSPIENLGIIIVDEEHETSYKAEGSPRINAIEVAQMRAKINKIPIILGSATPAIEHYYLSKNGNYKLLTMENRVNKTLPKIDIIDMRNELNEGNYSIFSRQLISEIDKNLKLKEQVLLFLNRRGYSKYVICKKCGFVFKCKNCSISLTYHSDGYLKCHYCGFSVKIPHKCPKCESEFLKLEGSGTQKVEQEIKDLFKNAKVLRLDKDIASKKDSTQKVLDAFLHKEADILIGTQMIAKGLHFPDLTLVGILNADSTLQLPDFKSKERTFQLITQVAGRAGRSTKKGRVIIQTYNPDDYSIVSASKNDYLTLYKNEITIRKILNYPPFCYMVNFIVSSDSEEKSKEAILSLKNILENLKNNYKFEIIGPTECLVYKIKNKFRNQIFIKIKSMKDQITVINKVKQEFNENKVDLIIDVNPINIY
ncbi:primosomal protein N' [Caldicellulosiruptoraceae bacterium PP1]